MKKKVIIGIVVACLVVAGVVTAVVIKNNKTKPEEEVQTSNELVIDEALANEDSMNKFGEAEDEPDTVYGGYTEADIDHYTDDGFVTKDGSYVITASLDERQKAAWNTYQKYYDDFSNYGPDFDAPPIGTSGTGYDSSLLVEKTTDKGCGCYVDTATGKVYYNGMTLPTGGPVSLEDHGAFLKWVLEDTDGRGECTVTNITYAQMQEIYGYPVN
ncbi:MAG: hypothetical protein IJ655_05130 [Lachnospiraceae bacterium]|nr:hypothetical protein [Lachnospiraceae bacterium]